MHRSVELMWADYLAHQHQPPRSSTAVPPAWHFCANEADANECAQLVLAGIKRATSPSLWSFDASNEALPRVGDLNIVTDWSGKAVCIIRTTNVQILPLDEITETHARIEGEGDGSLAWWRQAHWITTITSFWRSAAILSRICPSSFKNLSAYFRRAWPNNSFKLLLGDEVSFRRYTSSSCEFLRIVLKILRSLVTASNMPDACSRN